MEHHGSRCHHRATARPGREVRRTAAAAVLLVLGLGLVGGAVLGSRPAGGRAHRASDDTYTTARELWHNVPVEELFPHHLRGDGAGPGGADRRWTRVAVAPDSGCAEALDPRLVNTLRPVACTRVVRATYTDATASSVTTVGLVFTRADPAAMAALRSRFLAGHLAERPELMPRAFPFDGTVAAGFGDAQRASWTVNVLTDMPVVVYAVSGFADGRGVTEPQPAGRAVLPKATTAPAQAGLGHDAQGVAGRVERGLRRAAHAGPVMLR